MSLPTLAKTWQFNVNNQIVALGTALADNRRAIRLVKNALIGFSTNPHTVRYSCDSVTAGTAGDGVDRLTADSNFVWANAGSAHSWIVLRQTGVSATHEMCISCEGANASGAVLNISVADSPYTGGTTTARPTATDEQILCTSAWGNVNVDNSIRWSVMQSTDGQCTRVLFAAGNIITGTWILDKPALTTTGWTTPFVGYISNAAPTTGNLAASGGILKCRVNGTNSSAGMTVEAEVNGFIGPAATWGLLADEVDGGWPMFATGVASATNGVRGRRGVFQDLWIGSNSLTTLAMYPATGTVNQFAQWGILILPWDTAAGAVVLT